MRAKETRTIVSHFQCGPEGRFDCSDSVCSLWPALFSYLCVRVRILGFLVPNMLSASEDIKQKQNERKDFGVHTR